jgi:membrane protein YdbS with pleckstrin-like domain
MSPVVIHPDEKYKSKLVWVSLLVWLVAVASWSIPVAVAVGFAGGEAYLITGLTLAVNVIILWLIFRLVPVYYRSLRYEIHEDEVVVYAGIITKSVKHVPFRTVTNLKVSRDPFDRMLGIGQLGIQTAGMSGNTGGPEESLAGLVDVQGVYEQVARELRRFRGAMSPTQANNEGDSLSLPPGDPALLREILEELRAIRSRMEEA